MRESRQEQKERLLTDLVEGTVVRGKVSNLCDFGAFVNLGGADGLIHISELSWGRVTHPKEVLKVGDEIEVFVLNVDQERQRIGLSLKRLQPEPWSQVESKYAIDQVVQGRVTKLASFGAFVRIDDEIEGLIHVSELAERHVESSEGCSSGRRRCDGADYPDRPGAQAHRPQHQGRGRGDRTSIGSRPTTSSMAVTLLRVQARIEASVLEESSRS